MKVLLFTCGNSNLLSTWSNVPYLFAKTLEEKGHEVCRVDISPNKFLMHLFNSVSFRLYRKILRRNSCPIFQRTSIHRLIINNRIKVATRKNPNMDVNLFLSYEFVNKYSDKPSILWCDWSDAIVIQRQHRQPEWYEHKALEYEANSIMNASLVFSMFRTCAQQMTCMYGRPVICLNRNVVNTVYNKSWDIEDIIQVRSNCNKLLFIGNYLYKEGALKLLNSYIKLKVKYPNLQLHIIGMQQHELPWVDGIFCYGYLHKDIEEERDLYYKLLLSCRCLINPTSQWAGYSSTIEAMFYGTPIIVTPYDEFVEEFGNSINFGYYCNEANLCECIDKIMSSVDYSQMCVESHKRVENYTWEKYVDDFINVIS